MAVKYIKSTHTESLTDGEMGKMRLSVQGENTENIWVKRFGSYSVLQNHAINLYPFESWGTIIPSIAGSYDLHDMMGTLQLELHPEAWDEYIKASIITEDGTYIVPDDRPKPQEEKKEDGND